MCETVARIAHYTIPCKHVHSYNMRTTIGYIKKLIREVTFHPKAGDIVYQEPTNSDDDDDPEKAWAILNVTSKYITGAQIGSDAYLFALEHPEWNGHAVYVLPDGRWFKRIKDVPDEYCLFDGYKSVKTPGAKRELAGAQRRPNMNKLQIVAGTNMPMWEFTSGQLSTEPRYGWNGER